MHFIWQYQPMDINSLFVRARFAYLFVPNKSKIINKWVMLISLPIMQYSIADNVVKPFIIPIYIYVIIYISIIRIMQLSSFEVDYLIEY